MPWYVAAVRAVSGRSRDNNHCRRCLNEIETLPHILGFCPYGEALRNVRHHTIHSMLAEALKEIGFTVFQEVQGLATEGSVRRIDMIAIKTIWLIFLIPPSDSKHMLNNCKKVTMKNETYICTDNGIL